MLGEPWGESKKDTQTVTWVEHVLKMRKGGTTDTGRKENTERQKNKKKMDTERRTMSVFLLFLLYSMNRENQDEGKKKSMCKKL